MQTEQKISQSELLLAKGVLSVEQPEISENSSQKEPLITLNKVQEINEELKKLGMPNLRSEASSEMIELAWRHVRRAKNELLKKENTDKISNFLDIAQIQHLKRFKESFLEKMFIEENYSLIERYFETNENRLTTDEFLEYFKHGVFKVSGKCMITKEHIKNALGTDNCYYKLDSTFLYLFNDKKEYRLKLSQFDLLKYKTDSELLESKGLQVTEVKLSFAKSDLNKSQKDFAIKRANELIKLGETRVSTFITETNVRLKVVRELKKSNEEIKFTATPKVTRKKKDSK